MQSVQSQSSGWLRSFLKESLYCNNRGRAHWLMALRPQHCSATTMAAHGLAFSGFLGLLLISSVPNDPTVADGTTRCASERAMLQSMHPAVFISYHHQEKKKEKKKKQHRETDGEQNRRCAPRLLRAYYYSSTMYSCFSMSLNELRTSSTSTRRILFVQQVINRVRVTTLHRCAMPRADPCIFVFSCYDIVLQLQCC